MFEITKKRALDNSEYHDHQIWACLALGGCTVEAWYNLQQNSASCVPLPQHQSSIQLRRKIRSKCSKLFNAGSYNMPRVSRDTQFIGSGSLLYGVRHVNWYGCPQMW